MQGRTPLSRALRQGQLSLWQRYVCRQCRGIQISAAPTTESPAGGDAFGSPRQSSKDVADARFEVLGTPYSLLSVSLAASQQLYTRRGTLVAVTGKVESAQSTLSILSPIRRALLGVPFLYQRISSTTPLTALISTKSPTTTFTVLQLDGTTDWLVANRKALLAWTGRTLNVTPRVQQSLPLAHWGSSELTGRGLAALSAPGYIYQVTLGEREDFVAHPANVVAYSMTRYVPQPFRLKSSSLRFQLPSLTRYLPDVKFFNTMRETGTYKFLSQLFYNLRTSARRTIWGDRLFIRFQGPMTVLMSSRAQGRVGEILTGEQVNEIAEAPMGSVIKKVQALEGKKDEVQVQPPKEQKVKVNVASVGEDGKIQFNDAQNLKDFEKK